ncbi:hypothetical protein EIP91_011567 [Steccherinum ochraceum]|uniref:F-box domain-containing protein n=1 Tax=Steccherinum ochraceum TaxID=92696 RepID=A0A4R0RYD5_9APHY|nr:hypothetical protein EIP91_011567 [Steccherinum ochraceum]
MNLPSNGENTVYLQPRPLALSSGKLLLLPLLPRRRTTPISANGDHSSCNPRVALLLVCKTLKEVALPLFYSSVRITLLASLQDFTDLLVAADRKWDSIRRIPYSAPGRWVHALDLSDLQIGIGDEAPQADVVLTRLFPLLPFLQTLTLNSAVPLSRSVWESLSDRDGGHNLRVLSGVKICSSPHNIDVEESFVELLQRCHYLEELNIVGSGLEGIELAATVDGRPGEDPHARYSGLKIPHMPHLRKFSAISMHASAVMCSLLLSPLPSLIHLTLTPYDDISIPTSLVPSFIDAHGPKVYSLHLYAHKSWPTMLFPSPTTILHTCTRLHHLSLENPLPVLTICSIYPRYPLRVLSIPRPNPDFLGVLESLLPKLPNLRVVRTRDVRWLRRGMSDRALEAGVQGEMREWRRRLGRRGIRVLDADWTPGD